MLGAPGAGKGTQAQRIARDHGLPHISTGDIFRKHLKEGTDLGKQVQDYLNSGALVPDELTCAIVADRLVEPDCANGYILDGFPRSQAQAEALDAFLSKQGDRIDAAIDIDVPDEEIVERLGARRSCPVCGAVYNLRFSPPKGDDRHCDREGCGAELTLRDDDKPDTIRQRLNVYKETTKPIRAFYDERGLLRSIPAAGLPPDDVYAEVEEVLDSLGGL